jgi:hypothetical protein
MPRASVASADLAALRAAAATAGLVVLSSTCWPASDADSEPPALAGFIDSTFSPLIAEVAGRVLHGRPTPPPDEVVAIVIVTAYGDVTSAARVAATVDAGRRVSPLHFFQSVPNAVAGYLAARWQLTGPVACVSEARAGVEVAALLIDDADADAALVVRADVALASDDTDHGAGVLVARPHSRDF